MQQALWHFACRFEDEGIAAGCRALQQAELAVVDPGIDRELGEIAADEREMVAFADLADGAQALHRRLVPEAAAERVTGVRRIYDHPARAHDFDRAPDEARLRVVGMNCEKLGHDGTMRVRGSRIKDQD